jgi:CDP-diacylglycerol--glycerol-3-phosphate 3-phosphatidyltransferase
MKSIRTGSINNESRHDIFTFPNFLSVLRILLLLPFFYFLEQNSLSISYFIFGLMILTDFFDGFVARKFNIESSTGMILDPLADKICVASTIIYAIIRRDFPFWAALIILGRDILIIAAGFFLAGNKKMVIGSNIYGKLTVTLISIAILGFVFEISWLKSIPLYLSILMVVISSLSYAITLGKVLKEKENP